MQVIRAICRVPASASASSHTHSLTLCRRLFAVQFVCHFPLPLPVFHCLIPPFTAFCSRSRSDRLKLKIIFYFFTFISFFLGCARAFYGNLIRFKSHKQNAVSLPRLPEVCLFYSIYFWLAIVLNYWPLICCVTFKASNWWLQRETN